MDALEITVEELRRLLERGEQIAILDVRSAADRNEWFIPGSVHRDIYDSLRSGRRDVVDDLPIPSGLPLVVVCNRGRTSMLAVSLLRERGVPAVSLKGGMQAWSLAWNLARVPLEGNDAEVLQIRRTGKGCLSYLVGSAGEAAVIDASVDPGVYVGLARELGWRITKVLDTHIHADHLSRSRLLASTTGAALYLPEQGRAKFAFQPVRDGEILALGNIRLEVLATPGHTFESVCYLAGGRALCTGDTLFLNSVGRPDLAARADEETTKRAALLYRSLLRLLELPPETAVLPGHTANPVAFDGIPRVATLGEVLGRIDLLHQGEPEFVAAVLARIPPPPSNHLKIVSLNERGEWVDDPTILETGGNRCALS